MAHVGHTPGEADVGTLKLRPIKRASAKAFVSLHHRHNKAPQGDMFRVAVERSGELVGVGFAGRPVARELDDGRTVELTRVCTDGSRNACTMLYGALCRAAHALGYERAFTYTLASESGASLRAAGFKLDAVLEPRPTWNCAARARYQVNLWGDAERPAEAKHRWRRDLA